VKTATDSEYWTIPVFGARNSPSEFDKEISYPRENSESFAGTLWMEKKLNPEATVSYRLML